MTLSWQRSILAVVVCLLSANLAVAQPALQMRQYDDDTIKMAWITIEYASRAVRKSTMEFDKANPGVPLLRVFLNSVLKPNPRPRIEDSISYLEIRFRHGAERVRYKMANDVTADLIDYHMWNAEQIRQIATICESILVHRTTNKQPLPEKLQDAWLFTKNAAADPYTPDEDAAEIAARFLARVEKQGLGGLDPATKVELQGFKNKFNAPFKFSYPRLNKDFDPTPLNLKVEDLSKFRDFRVAMMRRDGSV